MGFFRNPPRRRSEYGKKPQVLSLNIFRYKYNMETNLKPRDVAQLYLSPKPHDIWVPHKYRR